MKIASARLASDRAATMAARSLARRLRAVSASTLDPSPADVRSSIWAVVASKAVSDASEIRTSARAVATPAQASTAERAAREPASSRPARPPRTRACAAVSRALLAPPS